MILPSKKICSVGFEEQPSVSSINDVDDDDGRWLAPHSGLNQSLTDIEKASLAQWPSGPRRLYNKSKV